MLKCKFCNWQQKAWITKGGKRIYGYARLKSHMELHHPEELEQIKEIIALQSGIIPEEEKEMER